MISSGSFGSLCECPCHRTDSKIAFCSSCYEVVCKTIRKAAAELGQDPVKLIAPFKDSPEAFELGR